MIQTSVSCGNRTTLRNKSNSIELLYHDESVWETLQNLRRDVFDSGGQFISLDIAEPLVESLPESLFAALKNARQEPSLPRSLSVMMQHNPYTATAFINRAIQWQRLCDLLIIDDEIGSETILVLENIDRASPTTQHEIARLIRFHVAHSLNRKFVFTLNRYSERQIIPELWDIFTR